jgi:signal recognition particle subunit SEC65
VDGKSLLSANLIINPIEFTDTRSRSSGRIYIGNGHPMCDILRDLQLSSNPIYYQYVPRSESILFPPRNMMDK